MSRLFVGTFLDEKDQEKFAPLPQKNGHLEDLWKRKTRWVKAVKLHLTWIFLGEVEDELVPKVSSTLKKILRERKHPKNEQISIDFSALKVWPTPRKPRMIVLSNEPGPKEVLSLARTLRTGLIPFYSEETEQEHNQEFRPHITLLRLDRRKDEDKKIGPNISPKVDPSVIHAIDGVIPVHLKVNNICLVKSHLGEGNNDYEVLERFALDGR
ncbi:MAG TPA: RNA 2',3'-cyclic phosphodiesterase [Chroococcales cyanobacterium]